MYSRTRRSQTARYSDLLRPEMEKLQRAIKRVSENWNDTVAQGIQTGNVNMIIGACNTFNAETLALSTTIEADLDRLEELSRLTQ